MLNYKCAEIDELAISFYDLTGHMAATSGNLHRLL